MEKQKGFPRSDNLSWTASSLEQRQQSMFCVRSWAEVNAGSRQNEHAKLGNYTQEFRVCARVTGAGGGGGQAGAGEGSAAEDFVRSPVVASV